MQLSLTQVLAAGGLFATGVLGDCHADNCYRALFPCESEHSAAWSIATSFCATITAAATTATNYPTRATSAWQCGTTPDQFISACACGPTCTPPPAPEPTLEPCDPGTVSGFIDGEFECGLRNNWVVEVPDTAAVTEVSSPGHDDSSDQSFAVHLLRAPETAERGVSARLISRSMAVVSNVPVKISYKTFFDNRDGGFVGLMVNDEPKKTTDARDLGWGVWGHNEYVWTPGPGVSTMVVKFEFLFNKVESWDRVDGIVVDYLH